MDILVDYIEVDIPNNDIGILISYEYKKPSPAELQKLAEKSYNALEVIVDYFINYEEPAKVVEAKPNLDYYDNRISARRRILDEFTERRKIAGARDKWDRYYMDYGMGGSGDYDSKPLKPYIKLPERH